VLIIPAIDLRAGRCVRLWRGDFARETVYDDDPARVARRWREVGAELLHVVDLDGARQGLPVQLDLIRAMARVAPVQVGGGLRTEEDVERALEVGASRVVLGTAALDIPFVATLAERYGDQIVVALDTREGMVAIRGWTEASGRTMLDLARALLRAGLQRFLHTDVERDGTMTAPNYASLAALIQLGAPVIASGGISSLDDLRRLRAIGAEAAIVGRALYEGAIDLREAIRLAR
jgi:phosphoribosylformimino-5-aminoimidazole carboxamide ribotide isomerase